MALSQQDIANLTLSELVMPGTHDTGTYALLNKLGPDVPKWVQDLIVTLQKLGITTPFQVIKNWAITQSNDVYSQLYNGARFLDVRVCYDANSNSYHTLHFILGSPTEEMLGNVSQFLSDFPNEVVLLQWGSFAGFNDTHHDDLIMLVEKYLGKFGLFPKSLALKLADAGHVPPFVGRPVKPLEPWRAALGTDEPIKQGEGDRRPLIQGTAGIEDANQRSQMGGARNLQAAGFTFTYSDMIYSGKRVLILYDDTATASRYDTLWPSHQYLVSDWANVDNFPAMVEHETKSVESQTGNPDAVYKLQWVLTCSANAIVEAILNPLDKVKDLHALSRLANGGNFNSFMMNMMNYRINLLMTDFQSEVNSLDWARLLNRLNCNDAREYRQFSCPEWKRNGLCASNTTVQQLCPLSCNACNWTRIAGKPGDSCSNNSQCLFGICNTQKGVCLNDYPSSAGEACGVDSQCWSGSCSNFACIGAPVNEVCFSDRDCGLHARCQREPLKLQLPAKIWLEEHDVDPVRPKDVVYYNSLVDKAHLKARKHEVWLDYWRQTSQHSRPGVCSAPVEFLWLDRTPSAPGLSNTCEGLAMGYRHVASLGKRDLCVNAKLPFASFYWSASSDRCSAGGDAVAKAPAHLLCGLSSLKA